jgi:hypothetical protein
MQNFQQRIGQKKGEERIDFNLTPMSETEFFYGYILQMSHERW